MKYLRAIFGFIYGALLGCVLGPFICASRFALKIFRLGDGNEGQIYIALAAMAVGLIFGFFVGGYNIGKDNAKICYNHGWLAGLISPFKLIYAFARDRDFALTNANAYGTRAATLAELKPEQKQQQAKEFIQTRAIERSIKIKQGIEKITKKMDKNLLSIISSYDAEEYKKDDIEIKDTQLESVINKAVYEYFTSPSYIKSETPSRWSTLFSSEKRSFDVKSENSVPLIIASRLHDEAIGIEIATLIAPELIQQGYTFYLNLGPKNITLDQYLQITDKIITNYDTLKSQYNIENIEAFHANKKFLQTIKENKGDAHITAIEYENKKLSSIGEDIALNYLKPREGNVFGRVNIIFAETIYKVMSKTNQAPLIFYIYSLPPSQKYEEGAVLDIHARDNIIDGIIPIDGKKNKKEISHFILQKVKATNKFRKDDCNRFFSYSLQHKILYNLLKLYTTIILGPAFITFNLVRSVNGYLKLSPNFEVITDRQREEFVSRSVIL